ncbi:hypothetical protein V5O48_017180 [Marasmius crinis-equi]|uniref:Uncharacterized protein n=1 Tax=Marasmius crinis-equi TaxID=585013 RepID=A0ABR3EPT4_9AGAR
MIPHLQNTLGTLPLHLVMPAVLDQWFFHPQCYWTRADIGTALQPNLLKAGIEEHKTLHQILWLDEDVTHQSTLFQQILHYNHILVNWRELHFSEKGWDDLREIWEKIWKELESSTNGSDFGLPFSFHTLDEILTNPNCTKPVLKLFRFCAGKSLHPQQFTHSYPLAHNLAHHIIATATACHRTFGSPVTTGSPFVRSETCLALIQQINYGRWASEEYFGWEEGSSWLEAIDIIQHIHALPPGYLPPLPDYFPIPLTKLEDLLWALPDEPSDSDFELLHSSLKYWPKVSWDGKLNFIKILSKYINEYPNLQGSHGKHSTDTPLATHQKGLEFIGFLYMKWRKAIAEDVRAEFVYTQMWNLDDGAWTRALECVRAANRWSPDMFEAIFTPIPDSDSKSPLVNNPLPQIEGGNTSMGAHAGGEDKDSTVQGAGNKDSAGTDDSDGAEPQSHKGTNQALEQPVKESGDSGVCCMPQRGEFVGGVGADDNV